MKNNQNIETMKHNMRLKDEPFRKIWNGKKTIELRLYDEKRKKIRTGDEIEFSNVLDDKRIVVKVIAIHLFDSFDELYRKLPLNKCGYDKSEKANPADMNQYYSLDEQSEYGVVGIEFEVIFKSS